jgi:squalene-hopene/tetraprenyl-beta-curcumene cyclase
VIDPDRLRSAYRTARDALLAERTPDGYWVGELSSSALATATAVTALTVVDRAGRTDHSLLIENGLRWLAEHQNADGGWGDTVKSLSNISTTMLCRAAFHATGHADRFSDALKRSETWLNERYGRTPAELAEAVRNRYGADRTFSVPILMMCALAGLVPWTEVPRLPFELACVPQRFYRLMRMPVVSYALPALIAIGQVVHHHRSTGNPVTRLLRWLGRGSSLRVLERIQPSSGGYLEATPLTSFVVMSLAAIDQRPADADRVIARGVEFIVNSVRRDGSWPIDSNLSIWVTTLAVNALASMGDDSPRETRDGLLNWLCRQQTSNRHPYTGAEPGAWGWSHLPGSVPDADDTPGALLALFQLDPRSDAAQAGLRWLLRLQNTNGGWPTFCRGWGKLPFDRSGTDLSAHALRALQRWSALTKHDAARGESWQNRTAPRLAPTLDPRAVSQAIERGFIYLQQQQRPDGSWLPLWFGNQQAPDDINPVYGTGRVLAAYRDLNRADSDEARGGVTFLLDVQNPDGGWGGAKGCPSSVEETALAVECLMDLAPAVARPAVERGIEYLVRRVEEGTFTDPSPIGFYFAKLWYFENLYPVIFTVAALGRAVRRLA